MISSETFGKMRNPSATAVMTAEQRDVPFSQTRLHCCHEQRSHSGVRKDFWVCLRARLLPSPDLIQNHLPWRWIQQVSEFPKKYLTA